MFTLRRGSAVMGSIEEITIAMVRMSLEESLPMKASLIMISSTAKRLTEIMVDMMPKNTMLPMFSKKNGFLIP